MTQSNQKFIHVKKFDSDALTFNFRIMNHVLANLRFESQNESTNYDYLWN